MTSIIEGNSFDDVEGRCTGLVDNALAGILNASEADDAMADGPSCSRSDFENALYELVALEAEERLLDALAAAEPRRTSLADTSRTETEAMVGPAASLNRAIVMLERDIGTSVQQLNAEGELCAVAARDYATSAQRLEDMKRDLEEGKPPVGRETVAVQTD